MGPKRPLPAEKVPPLKLNESGDSLATAEAQSTAAECKFPHKDLSSTVRFVQPRNHVMTTPPKHQFSSASDDADGPEIVATIRSRAPKSSHSKKGAVRKLFKDDDG